MEKLLIGIDPSFKRTGVSCYYKGRIVIDEIKGEANQDKSFEQMVVDVNDRSKRIFQKIDEIREQLSCTNQVTIQVISECPPPQGSFAPGLYALDMMLFTRMLKRGFVVYRVYPTYVGHIHGKRAYKKSESVTLAEKILKEFDVIINSKRLSHDEAESVIFLARNLEKEGLLPAQVIAAIPNLVNKKESQVVV